MSPLRFLMAKGSLLAKIDKLLEAPVPARLHDLEGNRVDLFALSSGHAVSDDEEHVNTEFLSADEEGWFGPDDKSPYFVAAYRKALELCFLEEDGSVRVDPRDPRDAEKTGRPIRSLWLRGLERDEFGMSVVDFGAFVCVIWLTPAVPDELSIPIPRSKGKTYFENIWAVERSEDVEQIARQFRSAGYDDVPKSGDSYVNCPGVQVFRNVSF